jgi:molecular chaperone GrpE
MADPSEKPAGPKAASGHFEVDIGEDAIREALESVKRHKTAAKGIEIEIEPPAAEAQAADGDPQGAAASDPAASGPSNEELQKELDEVKTTLEFSTIRAKETMDRLKETHERQLRAVADLDNYKKRAAREREETEKFGTTKLLKDLLPVLDNLDRALEHAATPAGPAAEGAAGPAEGALAAGVKATRKLFEEILGRYGVKGFSAKGQVFDPNRHEAMQQVPTSEVPPGTVAKEIVRGYFLHDRLLRPALVAVATAPQAIEPVKASAPEGGAAEDKSVKGS